MKLRADFMAIAKHKKPTAENKKKVRAIWRLVKALLPEQFQSHPLLFQSTKFSDAVKQGEQLGYTDKFQKEYIYPLPSFQLWEDTINELNPLYQSFYRKNVRDEEGQKQPSGKRHRKSRKPRNMDALKMKEGLRRRLLAIRMNDRARYNRAKNRGVR